MHPIGVRQHVPAHQCEYNEHNRGGHDLHHTHFRFFIVPFVLVRHQFLTPSGREIIKLQIEKLSRYLSAAGWGSADGGYC